MNIREATTVDFSKINFLMDVLGYPVPENQISNRQKIFEAVLKSPSQKIFVAEESKTQKLQALVSFTVVPQVRLAGLKMEIDELSVNPEVRGIGLGTQMVQFSMEHAKKLGVKSIIISSNRARESYQRDFYKKLGFVEKNSAFFEWKMS